MNIYIYKYKVVISVCEGVCMLPHHGKTAEAILHKICIEIHLDPKMVYLKPFMSGEKWGGEGLLNFHLILKNLGRVGEYIFLQENSSNPRLERRPFVLKYRLYLSLPASCWLGPWSRTGFPGTRDRYWWEPLHGQHTLQPNLKFPNNSFQQQQDPRSGGWEPGSPGCIDSVAAQGELGVGEYTAEQQQ